MYFLGQLGIDSFKVSDVVSLVDGIDSGSIEFLINALNELIISEDIAKKLRNGIKLPILLDFEQAATEVSYFLLLAYLFIASEFIKIITYSFVRFTF